MSRAGASPRHTGARDVVSAIGGIGHRIGETARIVGVSPSALRLWERQGLVHPGRTPGGYRVYSRADVEQLHRVQRMRTEQVSAPGIRRLMSVSPNPRAARDPNSRAPRGQRVRALRLEHGLSLRAAAERSRLSVSFLSAIERDATGVSLATLLRLTEAYGVTLLDLFEPGPGAGLHVRPRERPVLEIGAGVRIEQLARESVHLEPQLFSLAPGAASEGEYAHIGEEFLFVLEGELTFWVGRKQRYRLRSGDSLTFPSNLPHRWRNHASGETRLLWINTPPTF